MLQFYRTYLPESHGGVEEAIRQICIASGAFGAQHRVLTLARTKRVAEIQRPEAQVIQAPLQWAPASCSMGYELFRLYREHAEWADVIHIHYPWPFADLVHLLSGVRKPVVLTYHSDIVRQRLLEHLYRPLRSLFFSRVDSIVATSPNYQASSPVLRELGEKCSVIPLGLSPDTYEPPKEEVRARMLEQYGTDFFLFVGVLRYYKGLDTLLEAAARCDLPVVIAGHGPEEARLKAQAQALGLTNVKFAGFVTDDEKQALFEQCSAIVFPSCVRSEAFGVTLLEGQLHSKPLISCDIGTGTTFVNLAGKTGLVVPPNDAAALAQAMQTLAEQPLKAEQMGRAGRERLERVFSGEQVGRAYFDIYQRLATQKQPVLG
ncbi:glycosyltransferase [Marinobacter sp. S6332]|uniref:glycosyltransferase n=1 Tax=Marinobacter sp. S6332 TaxID=2926403 RepID=UPI001FF66C6E|nr:glycosyltransferase [Marinobacter sp. S6332]